MGGLSNDVRQILPRPIPVAIPVAMATKFDTKQAITPLVWKISWCRLHLLGGIRCGLLNDARQILSRPIPLPWQQNLIAYNSCSIRDISETVASNRGFLRGRLSNMEICR